MPKLKTSRAAAKRFKKTGTGKLVRNKAYKSHILTKKSTKRDVYKRQHLGEYLCFAVIVFTDFFILTDHTVMSADDNNAHNCLLYTSGLKGLAAKQAIGGRKPSAQSPAAIKAKVGEMIERFRLSGRCV